MYGSRMVRTSTGRLDAVVGMNVRQLREARGWRQIDVASRMAGLGHEQWRDATVAMVEGGNRNVRLDEVADLARVLDTTLVELLGGAPATDVVGDLDAMAAAAERTETERRFMQTFWRRGLGLGRASDAEVDLLDQAARVDYGRSLIAERDARVDEWVEREQEQGWGQSPTSKQIAGMRSSVTSELVGEVEESETFIALTADELGWDADHLGGLTDSEDR